MKLTGGWRMKCLRAAGLLLALLVARHAFSQSGAVIPQGGAGHATEATCVILKRMGPADQVTSRLYSFGIRGKQFQYVEGKLPSGFPFHGRLTDHDVRNLQDRGAEVLVLNQNFTADDLKAARADCRGETGKTPNQAEQKGPPQSTTESATALSATPSSAEVPSGARLSVTSVPPGADIEIDGNFVGNTPSDVQVTEGEHTVALKKSGFKDWERKLKVSSGSNVHLNADLDKSAPPN